MTWESGGEKRGFLAVARTKKEFRRANKRPTKAQRRRATSTAAVEVDPSPLRTTVATAATVYLLVSDMREAVSASARIHRGGRE